MLLLGTIYDAQRRIFPVVPVGHWPRAHHIWGLGGTETIFSTSVPCDMLILSHIELYYVLFWFLGSPSLYHSHTATWMVVIF